MRSLIAKLALSTLLAASICTQAIGQDQSDKPTIVLVHGAFADSSSWNGVITELQKGGFPVIAAANALRGVANDAEGVSALVKSIDGPVVLVGHSYGGFVVTAAANGNANVTALVYVAGFIPDEGESAFALSEKFPGSTLGQSLIARPLPDGGQDLYISPEKFHAQFAADVSEEQAELMAATQRPGTLAGLQEPSGAASWKTVPSYVIYGVEDRNIPAALEKFMAERAHARSIVAIEGASHALMISHAKAVAEFIEDAATESQVAVR
jgi:pimeloyl-ACP methyl ester carboxylesterase